MKKQLLKLIAVILAAALLLTGCGGSELGGWLQKIGALLGIGGVVRFEDMSYIRPDMDELRESLETCCRMAETETDVKKLMEEIWTFFGHYHNFYTNYSLADIHYCQDLTDIFWEDEYNYCLEYTAEVDAGIDRLLYLLAACDLREELEAEEYFGEGYFDAYEGESIWDDTFTALAEQEALLQGRYYELCSQASEVEYYSEEYFSVYGTQMGQLFVELVALRQQMAEYAGYDDYSSFAYDFYYYRDYTPAQAADYLEQIQTQLVPLYRKLPAEAWGAGYADCSEAQTYAFVKELANAAGGTVKQAFQLMDAANLYDISYGENKYDASFELFLTSYYEPFIFLNPTGSATDQLTFAHEFGHFCNDYASGGSVVGVDVAEIFSQGMEYLSLCRTEQGKILTAAKMADSLCVFVEQAAYASFEQQVYSLRGEELTLENVIALYEKTGTAYGFDAWQWDSRDFVAVTHFYTSPMYIISYVVSNDAALQIYQMEAEQPGTGLALLEEQFSTEEAYFLAFLESAGLESPFAPERIRQVCQTFRSALFTEETGFSVP